MCLEVIVTRKCQQSEVTHSWIVVINEVDIDPQLPHALKSIFKSETETNDTAKLFKSNHLIYQVLFFTLTFLSKQCNIKYY